jgi:hypothetical protein
VDATGKDEKAVTPRLPEWVEKRDGRREPFDADKISQALYTATEAIGSPNTFLARELADGVLHFLGQENEADTIKSAHIAEVVEKVVRELGQPGLAQACATQKDKTDAACAHRKSVEPFTVTFHADVHPEHLIKICLESFSLQVAFSRDLAAAHTAELLELSNLQAPHLMNVVIAAPTGAEASTTGWKHGWTLVQEASRRAELGMVVDGADWLVASYGISWLEGTVGALDAYQRQAILNIHAATPPVWATEISAGPLFGSAQSFNEPQIRDACKAILSARLRDQLHPWHVWMINWHVQQADFENPYCHEVVKWLLTQTDHLEWLTFTFDRPRRPINLFWGLDRTCPAVCLHVGLQLADMLAYPGIDGDGKKFLAKLPSLARMAVSAGVQKRNFLRRKKPDFSREFLVDRARLVIEPWNLESVVKTIVGTTESELGFDAARQVLQVLRAAVAQAGQAAGLDVLVDFQPHCAISPANEAFWRYVGGLSAVVDSFVKVDLARLSADEIWNHLRQAWQTPGVTEVKFWPRH